MTTLLRIAERVINRPLLVHPDKVPLILDVLRGRIPVGDVSGLREEAERRIEALPAPARLIMRGRTDGAKIEWLQRGASRFVGSDEDDDPMTGRKRRMPYRRTDGVAVITVTGSLINRGAWIGASSGETSYEGIKAQIAAAVADPKANAILLDIESPGGEAVGAFEVAEAVRAAGKIKPVHAVVNGMAASAAYAIASNASRIITTQTGLAGSIGVVMVHADYSEHLAAEGIKPTMIFAGAHKVDGNPFEPLSAAVRGDLQAEVNKFYGLFVKTVSAGRKNLNAEAIRATEARTFIGKDAVDVGLADSVGTFESALAELSRGTRRTTKSKGVSMDNHDGAPAANAGSEYIALEDHKAACADARKAGKAEGVAEGAKASQDRFAAILADDKVKGKERVALDLAIKSPSMAAEDVVSFVAGIQTAAAVPPIAERAQEDATGKPVADNRDAGASWGKAVERVNARVG